MTIKNITGWAILACLFGGLFAATTFLLGWLPSIVIWLATIVLVAVIGFAVDMISG